MKHIKETLVAIMMCLAVSLFPTSVYAESLQETLSAQSKTESIQEENSHHGLGTPIDLLQQHNEDELEKITDKADGIAQDIEQASIRKAKKQKAQPIVDATFSTPTRGSGFCAAWVSSCYKVAGYGYVGGNACDMYWRYCTSSNREDIIPGMIIAVPSHNLTSAGMVYGHVGIIVQHDGQYWVRHNVGPIAEMSLDEWIAEYGGICQPKWGFATDLGV